MIKINKIVVTINFLIVLQDFFARSRKKFAEVAKSSTPIFYNHILTCDIVTNKI